MRTHEYIGTCGAHIAHVYTCSCGYMCVLLAIDSGNDVVDDDVTADYFMGFVSKICCFYF